MSNIRIVAVKYTPNTATDFEVMMHHDDYQNALFIFNDNETEHKTSKRGGGNAVIRPYNRYSQSLQKPLSHGIPTGQFRSGYTSYTEGINAVHNGCLELSELISKYGYDTIVYNIADTSSPLLGCEIFEVDNDIKRYITRYILCLGKDFIVFTANGYSSIVPITPEFVNIV